MPFKKGEVPPGATPYKEGETGNPNGRPKKLPALDTLLAEILSDENTNGKSAAYSILAALRAKATKGDVRAAELLLNRGYGKVKESLEIEHSVSERRMIIEIVEPLPDDE